jgi:Zn-dependent protease with chaperone function
MSGWPRLPLVMASTLTVLALGCARAALTPASLHRDASPQEQSRLVSVVLPLLEGVKISVPRRCTVRLGVLSSAQINVSVAIRQEPGCPQTVALLITEGALHELPPAELRGLLAHQLGHVGLGHGTPPTYTADQERQADQVAVRVLLQVGGKEYCRGLANALTRMARASAIGAAWQATHLASREQAAAIRLTCETSPRESASPAPVPRGRE